MNREQQIKLDALNTSESILQEVLASVKGELSPKAKNALKNDLWGFDLLPHQLREDMIQDHLEESVEFYQEFINQLIPKLNEQILMRVKAEAQVIEKDRIIDNIKRK